MKNEAFVLLQQIEVLRGRINKYAHCKDLTSDKIISLSQRMDKLLNQYHKVINAGSLNKEAKPKDEFRFSCNRNIRLMPYETPNPIIVKKGKREYILIKLFE